MVDQEIAVTPNPTEGDAVARLRSIARQMRAEVNNIDPGVNPGSRYGAQFNALTDEDRLRVRRFGNTVLGMFPENGQRELTRDDLVRLQQEQRDVARILQNQGIDLRSGNGTGQPIMPQFQQVLGPLLQSLNRDLDLKERNHGMASTRYTSASTSGSGIVTRKLLVQGDPGDTPYVNAPESDIRVTGPADAKAIQGGLYLLGYTSVGGIDGKAGPRTQGAIESFQAQYGDRHPGTDWNDSSQVRAAIEHEVLNDPGVAGRVRDALMSEHRDGTVSRDIAATQVYLNMRNHDRRAAPLEVNGRLDSDTMNRASRIMGVHFDRQPEVQVQPLADQTPRYGRRGAAYREEEGGAGRRVSYSREMDAGDVVYAQDDGRPGCRNGFNSVSAAYQPVDYRAQLAYQKYQDSRDRADQREAERDWRHREHQALADQRRQQAAARSMIGDFTTAGRALVRMDALEDRHHGSRHDRSELQGNLLGIQAAASIARAFTR